MQHEPTLGKGQKTHPWVLDILEFEELVLDDPPQLAQRHDLGRVVQAMDERQAPANLQREYITCMRQRTSTLKAHVTKMMSTKTTAPLLLHLILCTSR